MVMELRMLRVLQLLPLMLALRIHIVSICRAIRIGAYVSDGGQIGRAQSGLGKWQRRRRTHVRMMCVESGA